MAKFSAYMRGEGTLGPTGDPAGFGNISVSTTTLASNQNASVTITTDPESANTAKDFYFNFGIPKGVAAGIASTHNATATSINSASTPTIAVSASGADTAKKFTFNLGIPKGEAAGFGNITTSVSTLASNQSATTKITTSGENKAKNFNFHFGIPVGKPAGFGTPIASAEVLPSNSQPTITITSSGEETAKVFNFKFGIPAANDKTGYKQISFSTGAGAGYNWSGNTLNITRTITGSNGYTNIIPISICKEKIINNSTYYIPIAADFTISTSTIQYEADAKFAGCIYCMTV